MAFFLLATRARPWNCGDRRASPLFPFYRSSLWCAGGNLISHFLLSLFFSQKSPPLRGARTPDKHGAIEGAECSWSSELLRAGVGLPEPKPRGHRNQSAWFVGVCEEKFIRYGASLLPFNLPTTGVPCPRLRWRRSRKVAVVPRHYG